MKTLNQIFKGVRSRTRRYYVRSFGKYGYISYWHYILHGESRNPDTSEFYLSATPNRGAGIGHQMANWIAGFWYAKVWNIGFAHIPFSTIAWENFLGFGIGEKSVSELKQKGWKIRRIPLFNEKEFDEVNLVKKIISSYSGQKVIFHCEQDQFYADQYGVMNEIQAKFFNSPSRINDHIIYDKSNFNIAIHVRRGDIMADPSNPNLSMRYLSNDYFEKVLTQVCHKLYVSQNKPIHIYFFSQGCPDDYPEFAKFSNLHWCLDMGAKESFLHMVYADVLITSKSSFSYKPALINRKGIKVCPKNFWHGYPKTNDWVLCDNDGTISNEELSKL